MTLPFLYQALEDLVDVEFAAPVFEADGEVLKIDEDGESAFGLCHVDAVLLPQKRTINVLCDSNSCTIPSFLCRRSAYERIRGAVERPSPGVAPPLGAALFVVRLASVSPIPARDPWAADSIDVLVRARTSTVLAT